MLVARAQFGDDRRDQRASDACTLAQRVKEKKFGRIAAVAVREHRNTVALACD